MGRRGRPRGFLGRLSERLTESLQDSDAAELAGSVKDTGCDCVAECGRGDRVTIVGRIRTVRSGGAECETGVTAEVFDGTDAVDVCWLGRRSLPGIDTGRHIRVVGRIGGKPGSRIMFNPRYELLECPPGQETAGGVHG